MKVWLAKHGRGWLAADNEAIALHQKMGLGECAEFSVIQPRSYQWHKMYFGICREIGQNQDPVRDEDSIDYEVRVLAGHFNTLWVDGHEVRVPKRIAFANLTADEWAALWLSIELAINEHYGEGYVGELAKTGTW